MEQHAEHVCPLDRHSNAQQPYTLELRNNKQLERFYISLRIQDLGAYNNILDSSNPNSTPIWRSYLSHLFTQLSISASSVRLVCRSCYSLELMKLLYSAGSYDPPYSHPNQVRAIEIPKDTAPLLSLRTPPSPSRRQSA
jgi:hypothetical protein